MKKYILGPEGAGVYLDTYTSCAWGLKECIIKKLKAGLLNNAAQVFDYPHFLWWVRGFSPEAKRTWEGVDCASEGFKMIRYFESVGGDAFGKGKRKVY